MDVVDLFNCNSKEKNMDFNGYQHQANMTAVYRERRLGKIIYPSLKLAGESGEFAEKIGKLIRDYDYDPETTELDEETRIGLAKEIGDVLWYCAVLATDLSYNLGQIAQMNLDKLNSRQERGVLAGSGDNR